MTFITDDFMLHTPTAKELYQSISQDPIIDFHYHLSPKEIYEDRPFDNIVDLWLAGDHYKWRAMRAHGISEAKITGNSTPEEKFAAWADTVENLIGNPLYHWTHLELKQVFGWEGPLSHRNWQAAYNYLNHFIYEHQLSARKLISSFNVEFIGTTDGPLDSLSYHEKLANDPSFSTVVVPTFRPDIFFDTTPKFKDSLKTLAKLTELNISTYQDLLAALDKRLEYFIAHGCLASDHSFQTLAHYHLEPEHAQLLFEKLKMGQELTLTEQLQWQSKLFADLCSLYHQHQLVVQVHFGALRNNYRRLFQQLGVDSGFDSMNEQTELATTLNRLLDDLASQDKLPKMIFYNLNPAYNELLANTLANFQANEANIAGKLQFGAAWWFNDTKRGMLHQLETYAEQGLLAHFIGMLTDSRSFLSYPRHDYFRRILCNLVGDWVETGEAPHDETVFELVKNISYRNAQTYFGGNKNGNDI